MSLKEANDEPVPESEIPSQAALVRPGLEETLGWLLLSCLSFILANRFPLLAPLLLLYLLGLCQLTRIVPVRLAFYLGLFVGMVTFGSQLTFFWHIFGPAAILLWLVLAFWIGAFTGLGSQFRRRLGPNACLALFPVAWLALEYFRSELYFLKFSWLTNGALFVESNLWGASALGNYGTGAVLVLLATWLSRQTHRTMIVGSLTALLMLTILPLPPANPASVSTVSTSTASSEPEINIGGIQLEFPSSNEIPQALSQLMAEHPDLDLIVLSEYTLQTPPTEEIKAWCRANQIHLIIGGKDPLEADRFRNTVYVINPEGKIVFWQTKSAPIQFFDDGEPAAIQRVWESPWGKIGLCICYDLSFSRVTDELVRQGAQLLIVPTMDVVEWGRSEHLLHARIAPMRAAEYTLPIFRLASSGISQSVTPSGRVVAEAPFPGQGTSIVDHVKLVSKGRLPLDRFIAPMAIVITALSFLYSLCAASLPLSQGKSLT